MLFIDDQEVERILTHPENISHKVMHDKKRPKGALEIPLEQKALIGTLAKIVGPSVTSEVLGVSVSQASNFSHGKSVHGQGNPELKALVDGKIKDIHELTADKLLGTIEAIDLELVRHEKPMIQSSIAKNLAGIIESTSEKGNSGAQVQVIVYAPQPVSNMKFETVEIEAVNN